MMYTAVGVLTGFYTNWSKDYSLLYCSFSNRSIFFPPGEAVLFIDILPAPTSLLPGRPNVSDTAETVGP